MELSETYINPNGKLFKDIKFYHWSICFAVEGIEGIKMLDDQSIDAAIGNKSILIMDEREDTVRLDWR